MFEFKVTAQSIPELMEKIAALSAQVFPLSDVEVPLPEPRVLRRDAEPGEPPKRRGRPPKAAAQPQEAPPEPEEGMHATQGAQDGGMGVLELGTPRPTGTASAPSADAGLATSGSAGPASGDLLDRAGSGQPEASPPTSGGEPEAETITEGFPDDLPAELAAYIDTLETVENWPDTKTALQDFMKTKLFSEATLEHQNKMRANTLDTLMDRGVTWLPSHLKDVSLFRLWIETQTDSDNVRGGLITLKADPEFQAKSEALRGQIEAAAMARVALLEG